MHKRVFMCMGIRGGFFPCAQGGGGKLLCACARGGMGGVVMCMWF